MLSSEICIEPGILLTSPGGRVLEVCDVFVPRNDQSKSRHLPSAFRGAPRKVVVFRDGSLAHLNEVRRFFKDAGPGIQGQEYSRAS